MSFILGVIILTAIISYWKEVISLLVLIVLECKGAYVAGFIVCFLIYGLLWLLQLLVKKYGSKQD